MRSTRSNRSAFDREAHLSEVVTQAIAEIAVQLDAAIVDGAACSAGSFEFGRQFFQERVIPRKAIDDGDHLPASSLLLHAQLRDDARGYRVVGFLAAALAVRLGPAATRTDPSPCGRIDGARSHGLIIRETMISFARINKQYGRQVLFVDASFQLNPGEKVGLVGPNGSGKTTLFRMVVGEEAPDDGEVSVPRKLSIGYFRQDVEEMKGRSVLDEAIAGSGRAGDLHHELEDLQRAMEDPERADDMDRILAHFGEVQEEYDHLGGYALEAQAREVLHGLGFEDDQID